MTSHHASERTQLVELLAKYRTMLAMRLAHERGSDTEDEARSRMAELARRFPGALREIDDLELEVIRDRIRRLEAALGGEGPVEVWMRAVALFHSLARGALRAKRWLAGRKAVDGATVAAFSMYAASGAEVDALAWADDLALIAAPPRGRVMDLVFARVAGVLGTSELQARHLVFGTSRRDRRH